MDANLAIKQFRHDGALSYVLYDQKTLDAVVIDAHVQKMEDYRSALWESRLRVVLAADTGAVPGEFAASSHFRNEFKCDLLGAFSKTQMRVTWAGHDIEILETPGASHDAMSLLLNGLVFTGDALWIGETIRTDRGGADAAKLWKSARDVLGKVPESTLIFPGHDYSGFLFSVMEVEKRKNPVYTCANPELFFELKRGEEQSPRGRPSCASISVEKFKKKMDEKSSAHLCVDVRDEMEFQESHISGAINIPMEEIAFRLPKLRQAQRIYLICQSGRRSPLAAATLDYIGLSDVVLVSGGLKAWSAAGFPVLGPKKISV